MASWQLIYDNKQYNKIKTKKKIKIIIKKLYNYLLNEKSLYTEKNIPEILR